MESSFAHFFVAFFPCVFEGFWEAVGGILELKINEKSIKNSLEFFVDF